MAIQKKSLLSGTSTPKKAGSPLPQVSENPGLTKVAHTRVTVNKVSAHRVTATKVAATRVAATKVASTRVAPNRVRID